MTKEHRTLAKWIEHLYYTLSEKKVWWHRTFSMQNMHCFWGVAILDIDRVRWHSKRRKKKIHLISPCCCVPNSITNSACVCFPLCEKAYPRQKQKMVEHTMGIMISFKLLDSSIYRIASQQYHEPILWAKKYFDQ